MAADAAYPLPALADEVYLEMIETDLGWLSYDVYPTFAEFSNSQFSRRFVRRPFTPSASDRRFRVVEFEWRAPWPHELGLSEYEAESAELRKAYRRVDDRMRAPRSWVDVPRGFAGQCEMIMDETEAPVTRAEAIEKIAARNQAAYAMPHAAGVDKATAWVWAAWVVALELGEPLAAPLANVRSFANGIGREYVTLVRPTRLMRPTAAELRAHRIEKARQMRRAK